LGDELKQLVCQGRMLGLGDQQLRDVFQSALADSRAAGAAVDSPGENAS
jgi:hypothetical protein